MLQMTGTKTVMTMIQSVREDKYQDHKIPKPKT